MRNLRQKKFVPIAKHAFDLKSLRQTQQAVNALLNGAVIVGKTGQIHYADGNTIFEIPQATFEPFHPFKIYQPKNLNTFTQGMLFNDADGNYQTCAIDSTVPTDFSVPTVNPSTDSWRIWSVRAGEIEYRLKYNLAPGLVNPWSSGFFTDVPTGSNFAWICPVIGNTDLIGGYFQNEVFPSFTDPLGEGYSSQTASTNGFPLIIGDSGGSSKDFFKFSFWINIIPETIDGESPTYPSFEIRARDWTNAGNPFVGSNFSVPVGTVLGGAGFTPSIDQMVFDHIKNRYPSTIGGYGFGSYMNFRGVYDYDENLFNPSDLDKQFFYPGDIINVKYGGNFSFYQFGGFNNNFGKLPNGWISPITSSDLWAHLDIV